MPRRLRHTLRGIVFHVHNRAHRRAVIFLEDADYEAFLAVVREALGRSKVRIIAYCVMPNHWHFLVICDRIADLSKLMHWIEGTHASRWNVAHGTRGTGGVYQGRFGAVPIETSSSFLRVCRYVERNPVKAKLVTRAEDWQWSSAAKQRTIFNTDCLGMWPILRPPNWIEIVNTPETEREFDDIRKMIRHNQPIGSPEWQQAVAPFCGLSMRPIGRPKKDPRPL